MLFWPLTKIRGRDMERAVIKDEFAVRQEIGVVVRGDVIVLSQERDVITFTMKQGIELCGLIMSAVKAAR